MADKRCCNESNENGWVATNEGVQMRDKCVLQGVAGDVRESGCNGGRECCNENRWVATNEGVATVADKNVAMRMDGLQRMKVLHIRKNTPGILLLYVTLCHLLSSFLHLINLKLKSNKRTCPKI